MTKLASFALSTLSLFSMVAAASAQEGGVGHSGMEQGHAQISTRADVAMTLSTMEGTAASRLTAIGPELSTKMSTIRQCYAGVTERRPTVTGTLSINVTAPARGTRIEVAVNEDHVSDAELVRCATRAFTTLRVTPDNRPMGVVVHLTFSNSAARGVEATEAHRAEQTSVEIVGSGADATVRGHIPTGEVSFTARGPSTEAELRTLGTFVLDHVAVLLDCRRRAGRRGASPERNFTLVVDAASGRVTAVRVAAETPLDAPVEQCVLRAFRPLRPPATLTVSGARVDVRFGPSAPQ